MTPGYPVDVFGGRHADVALDESMATALARLIGARSLACVVDLSELGSAAARHRFMTGFAETLYEANADLIAMTTHSERGYTRTASRAEQAPS